MSLGHQLSNLVAATLFGGAFICANLIIKSLDGALALTALAVVGGLALTLCIVAAMRSVRGSGGRR